MPALTASKLDVPKAASSQALTGLRMSLLPVVTASKGAAKVAGQCSILVKLHQGSMRVAGVTCWTATWLRTANAQRLFVRV